MSRAAKKDLLIDAASLKNAAHHIRALNHGLRQNILNLIHKNEKMSVTGIYQHFDMEQAYISQHLTILRKAKLVHTEKKGKFIYYSVHHEGHKRIHHVAHQLVRQHPSSADTRNKTHTE